MASVPVDSRRRALLSVTDKTRLEEVGKALHEAGYQLIASGGTAGYLRDHALPVTGVSDLTGYPEIFGGRVKTLHPVIHGGILGPDRDSFAATRELGIEAIDVVVVNLYRFTEAVAEGASPEQIVEKIDIGGPTLLRAAAKNFQRVTVVSDPSHYDAFLADLANGDGETTLDFRRAMAADTFARIERYDTAISAWFATQVGGTEAAGIPLRYGENPHQSATLHLPPSADGEPLGAIGLHQHGGKALSYNNIVDLVAALKLAADFHTPGCAVIKHTNPCGFGLGAGVEALERALKCDPVSAFGGVFAFNQTVDLATAEILAGRFLEIIAAPAYDDDALKRLTKKKNVRVLTVNLPTFLAATADRRRAWGDLVLRQDEDVDFPELEDWKVAAGEEPDEGTRRALAMVWKVCKHGKSNAIVIGDGEATLGMGFGQMSRVDSVALATMKAAEQGLDLTGTVAASDGFFPFPDGIQKLAEAGVKTVIAPGGSIRDDEVAAAAKDLGVTLILTGRRHFNH